MYQIDLHIHIRKWAGTRVWLIGLLTYLLTSLLQSVCCAAFSSLVCQINRVLAFIHSTDCAENLILTLFTQGDFRFPFLYRLFFLCVWPSIFNSFLLFPQQELITNLSPTDRENGHLLLNERNSHWKRKKYIIFFLLFQAFHRKKGNFFVYRVKEASQGEICFSKEDYQKAVFYYYPLCLAFCERRFAEENLEKRRKFEIYIAGKLIPFLGRKKWFRLLEKSTE